MSCRRFRPDHNGECLDCDERIEDHTVAAGGIMRSELRVRLHAMRPGESVIEIWYDGAFVGQITAAEGPGVHVISKHALVARCEGRAGELRVYGAPANVISVAMNR